MHVGTCHLAIRPVLYQITVLHLLVLIHLCSFNLMQLLKDWVIIVLRVLCHKGPVNRQNSAPGGYPQANSCSLAKLQQLTNGLNDIMPENQMTPPPTMTPPPPHMTPTSPSMIRNMATPPVTNLQSHSQNMPGSSLQQSYKSYQRQRSSSTRKSPNVTVNPNMPPFTPNVTILSGIQHDHGV